jgi:hypothetical protein
LALPVSWEHHLLLLLPVLAFLWSRALAARWERVLLIVATVLLEVCWLPLCGESAGGRLVASLPLMGNLMLFVLTARYLLRSRPLPSVEAIA